MRACTNEHMNQEKFVFMPSVYPGVAFYSKFTSLCTSMNEQKTFLSAVYAAEYRKHRPMEKSFWKEIKINHKFVFYILTCLGNARSVSCSLFNLEDRINFFTGAKFTPSLLPSFPSC